MKYLWVLLVCCSLLGCGEPSVQVSGSCADVFGDVKFSDLDGREARLPCSGHAVLVVSLWATWCNPCRLEVPHLVEIAREYQARGVQVIGICLDSATAAGIKPAVAGFGITYPVLVGSAETVLTRMGIDGIPTTLIIAADGRIDKALVGYHTKEELLAPIQELLKPKEKPKS